MKISRSNFIFLIILTGCATEKRHFDYPLTRTDNIVGDYHGTKVHDPYRWLEDPNSEETLKWVEAQNKITDAFINSSPTRKKIKDRLTELWNYPKYSVPRKIADRYVYSKNDGLQNQSVLYMQKGLDGKPLVVIDPNNLSPDGTTALTSQVFSRDGNYLAYGISKHGSDWQEIKIRNVDTGKDYDEVIKYCRYAGIGWKHDNSGFYYNRHPEPGTVPKEDQTNYSRVYWHKLGTPQSEDKLVYERPENKELGLYPFITDDGKYLIIHIYHGTSRKNGIYYREVESDKPFTCLFKVGEARFNLIDNIERVFYVLTDLDAHRGRIVAVDLENPDRKDWKEIIPQQGDVVSHVKMVNDKFVIAYMHNAHHLLKLYDVKGKFIREIELPTLGSVHSLSGKRLDNELFFGFESFLFPITIFKYDLITNSLDQFHKSEIEFDPSIYQTKQVFYNSKDGTRVPMFITHRKGLELNGNNPTLLYGYGGFNIGLTPHFSVSRLVWLSNGGVHAVANIRGGNEFGEDWHKGGMLDKKQNCFDDFIAAAEWLIKLKYTSPEKLAIQGGSNGGLLVAACMTQRPELLGAVICQVPLTDMLRYHKFAIGRYWIPEYGDPETNQEHFNFIYAYSPLHNVKRGTAYPPTLIISADTDDRVVPVHAKKFAAALQSADIGKNPILLRIETMAGHGAWKPTTKVIDEVTDIYTFLFQVFGMNMK